MVYSISTIDFFNLKSPSFLGSYTSKAMQRVQASIHSLSHSVFYGKSMAMAARPEFTSKTSV